MNLQELREKAEQAKHPENSEQVRNLVAIIAKLEAAVQREARAVHEAVGHPDPPDAPKPVDERVEELATLAGAKVRSEFPEWFVQFDAPDGLQKPQQAKAYLGLSEEEWQQQISSWAENYREVADEDLPFEDRELAEKHVTSTFGLSLEEFEREIVYWSPEEMLGETIAGPLEDIASDLGALSEVLEGHDLDIDAGTIQVDTDSRGNAAYRVVRVKTDDFVEETYSFRRTDEGEYEYLGDGTAPAYVREALEAGERTAAPDAEADAAVNGGEA